MANARADYDREFRLAYDAVIAAYRQGYHAPYANLHSDDYEWQGYEDGFRAACNDIAHGVVARVS
jgi:hypothetical protein